MLTLSGRLLRAYWLETLMVLPLILYIGLLTLVPVLQAIGMSFTDRYTGAFPSLSNYQYIVSRPDFGAAFVNTIGITVMGVAMEMTAGIVIALMLARAFRGRSVRRPGHRFEHRKRSAQCDEQSASDYNEDHFNRHSDGGRDCLHFRCFRHTILLQTWLSNWPLVQCICHKTSPCVPMQASLIATDHGETR